MTWKELLKVYLTERYNEQYAERCLQHLDWIISYPEHGAPGHMDFVLIKALVVLLDADSEQPEFLHD